MQQKVHIRTPVMVFKGDLPIIVKNKYPNSEILSIKCCQVFSVLINYKQIQLVKFIFNGKGVTFLGIEAAIITRSNRKETGHGWKHIQDY